MPLCIVAWQEPHPGTCKQETRTLTLIHVTGPNHGDKKVTTCINISFNSLAPGKIEWNFKCVIFKRNLVIDGWGISSEITLIWMLLDFTDYQSTLVQVMAWCRQATSHYLSQCWPRSLSPYGVTRPQWVKSVVLSWQSLMKVIDIQNVQEQQSTLYLCQKDPGDDDYEC